MASRTNPIVGMRGVGAIGGLALLIASCGDPTVEPAAGTNAVSPADTTAVSVIPTTTSTPPSTVAEKVLLEASESSDGAILLDNGDNVAGFQAKAWLGPASDVFCFEVGAAGGCRADGEEMAESVLPIMVDAAGQGAILLVEPTVESVSARFDAPSEDVRVDLHDIALPSGRLLGSAPFPPGATSVQFEPIDESGRALRGVTVSLVQPERQPPNGVAEQGS